MSGRNVERSEGALSVIPPRQVARVLAKACRMDVVAFKPGNVSLCAPGHGMTARDFLVSAREALPALISPQPVGRRVRQAVAATRTAVGCNTNLGIVLLLAPIAAAAAHGGGLQASLAQVLEDLTEADARECFAAIVMAQPAGLGQADAADVREAPQITLLEAMQLAATRDRIALQYASGYADVFATMEVIRELRARWRSLAWAVTAGFLDLLSSFPDSHIQRKHGPAAAARVQARVSSLASAVKACENPRSFLPAMKQLDRELKADGINPGTSADLTVASVAALLLSELPATVRSGDDPRI